MFRFTKESVIYVVCPSNYKSGGPELAHQLVYQINQNKGISAMVAYYDLHNRPLGIHDAFKKYVSAFVSLDDVVDDSRNLIIALENRPEILKKYKNIQKGIWWMSVDNYKRNHDFLFFVKHYRCMDVVKSILLGRFNFRKITLDNSITHFYQSEYARDFLEKMGITNVCRLSDYLNSEYLCVDPNTERENVVLYNPSKGFKFTKKIIEAAPDIRWKPLQNMTTEQVKNTLLHSKVYIDFGNHPGKDRFPREAAMCGCCVITGKRGSAKFFEDVPIDDEFKFDENVNSIRNIVEKIQICLDDYSNQSKKFEGYRDFMKKEYDVFQNDVKSIFFDA